MSDQPVSWLMFFTLAAVIVIAGGSFIWFLRSQSNRDTAHHALGIDGADFKPTRPGALPELVGVVVIIAVALGILAAGYKYRGDDKQTDTSTAATVGTGGPSTSK